MEQKEMVGESAASPCTAAPAFFFLGHDGLQRSYAWPMVGAG